MPVFDPYDEQQNAPLVAAAIPQQPPPSAVYDPYDEQQNVPRETLPIPEQQQPSFAEKFARTAMPGLGLPRLAGNVLAGASQFGQGLESAPYNIARMLGVSPETLSSRFMPQPTNIDLSALFGAKDPNIVERLLQGAVGYIPAAMTGGSTLLGQVAAGTAYGATQSTSPLSGALIGAAAAVAAPLIGSAGRALFSPEEGASPIKDYLSKYAAPGITKGIGEDIGKIKDIKNSDVFDRIVNNYEKHENIENKAWDELGNQASKADTARNYNNEDYVSSLKNEADRLKIQSLRQTAYERTNKDAIELLQGYQDDFHNSFSRAIEHNKALNQDYKNEITPGKSVPFNAVNYAKSALKENFENNLEKEGLQDTLGQAWSGANDITANKNSIFNEITTPSGKTQPSLFMKYYRGDKEYSDPTNFIKEYLPTGVGEGTQKMEQLAAMVGDKNIATDAIKSNLFGEYVKPSEIDVKGILNKYSKLSPEQQSYIFSPEQHRQLIAAEQLGDKLTPKDKGLIGFGAWHSSLSALLGLGIGHHFGHPIIGALVGSSLSNILGKGISKGFERPGIQRSFVDYLNKRAVAPPQQAGETGMLNNILRAALVPQTMPQQEDNIQ